MTGGEAHEVKGYDALMELHDINPGRLLGDKGYDSDDIRNDLANRGIEPVIPPRSNRKTPIEYDREAYKRRNLIERCVNRLKQFRRIATRYEKTARAYLSMLSIAAARLWIKTVNTASGFAGVFVFWCGPKLISVCIHCGMPFVVLGFEANCGRAHDNIVIAHPKKPSNADNITV